jgi:hypothetical protein
MKNTLLIATVSASLIALSGCKPSTEEPEKSDEKIVVETKGFKFSSIPPEAVRYGDATDRTNSKPFSPRFDVVAYFHNDGNQLHWNIQYFETSGNSYQAIRDKVKICIAKLDAEPDISKLPACENSLKTVGSDDFTFRAPSNLIFVARSPTVKFIGDESFVIGRNLQYAHPEHGDKKSKPNKSFYNAKLMNESGRDILYVQNYFTKKVSGNQNDVGDTPIGLTKPHWYSMNLFVKMPTNTGGTDQIIIDPDTGNMGTGGNP